MKTACVLRHFIRQFHGRQWFSQTFTTKEPEEKMIYPSNSFVYFQFPNNSLRISDRLANSSATFLTSRLSKTCWCRCRWVTARPSVVAVMVLCNRVLSRLRALNDLSVVHEVAGHNKINLIKRCTAAETLCNMTVVNGMCTLAAYGL